MDTQTRFSPNSRYTVCQKNLCTEEKNVKFDLHSRISTIKSLHTFLQLHTIDNVLKNWNDHVGYCMASRGSHLNEIIFHY